MSSRRRVATEMPYQNLEEVQKDVSKTFEQMKKLESDMLTTQKMLEESGQVNMSEEVGSMAKAVTKSIKHFQMNFPHLIPFGG